MHVTQALFLALALSFALEAIGSQKAFAGDRGEWLRGLKMPGTVASCCDIADCERTDSDWRDGQWWAVVDNIWRPVPPSKVLTDQPSLDGAAYVCVGAESWTIGAPRERPIYCFVPPNCAM